MKPLHSNPHNHHRAAHRNLTPTRHEIPPQPRIFVSYPQIQIRYFPVFCELSSSRMGGRTLQNFMQSNSIPGSGKTMHQCCDLFFLIFLGRGNIFRNVSVGVSSSQILQLTSCGLGTSRVPKLYCILPK